MLPYRSRRIQKRRTQATANDAPPPTPVPRSFRHALVTDLLTMRTGFLQSLTLQSTTKTTLEIGHVFGVCKSIFRQRRVAAWHTRFVPPRCDTHAWSQLIYAACLSVLPLEHQQQEKDTEATVSYGGEGLTAAPEEETTDNDPTQIIRGSLAEAAFAIFALYILHETNPMPRGDKVKGYQLLPTGHRNREIAHALYRRNFRPWIRVDPIIFASLLHWREEARAQSESSSGPLIQSIAQDVLAVLENLWNQFDYVSYTGPRGLEAMGDHPDYPYKRPGYESVPDNAKPSILTHETGMTVDRQVATVDSKNEEEDPKKSLCRLHEKAKEYVEACRSIRIPAPVDERHRRRLERLRTALTPLFSDTPGMSVEALLSKLQDTNSATTVLQSRPRMVTFSVYESVVSSRKDDPTGESRSAVGSNHETDHNEGHESYELVLPLGTPAPLRRSLECAVKSFLESDSMALVGSLLPTVSVPVDHAHNDAVSTLAPPSSVATWGTDASHFAHDHTLDDTSSAGPSNLSHAGRDALAYLLKQTKQRSATTRKRGRPRKNPVSVASVQSNAGQEALRALLEQVGAGRSSPKRRQSAAMASSSASAQSNVGREALQVLLQQVSETAGLPVPGRSTASTSAASIPSNEGREALETLLEQANAESPASKRPRQSSTKYSGGSVQSNAGREALKGLLEQVGASLSKKTNQSKTKSSIASAQSGAGRDELDLLLQQVKDNGQGTVAASAKKGNTASLKSSGAVARSPAYSHASRGANFLLDQKDLGDPAQMVEPDDLSDFSGDEQDDFSIALSSMGRKAMQELLDSVEPKKKTGQKPRERKDLRFL